MIPQMFMHLHLRLHHAAISLDPLLLQYFGTAGGRQFGDYELRWLLHILQGDLPELRLPPLYRGDNAWRWLSSNILDLYGGCSWSPWCSCTYTYGCITQQVALTDSYNILAPQVAEAIWRLWATMASSPSTRWSPRTTPLAIREINTWRWLSSNILDLYGGYSWSPRCSCTYTYGCITQQVALTDSYYNILAPQVAGNLATTNYDGLFTLYNEFVDLCIEVFNAADELFNCFEQSGKVPSIWCFARQVHLPKDVPRPEGRCDASKLRPVSLLSSWYRLWGSARLQSQCVQAWLVA